MPTLICCQALVHGGNVTGRRAGGGTGLGPGAPGSDGHERREAMGAVNNIDAQIKEAEEREAKVKNINR